MAHYYIGIDTGGTYTDGVLLDGRTGGIIHSVKEQTTHHDLGVGVGRALSSLFSRDVRPADVAGMAVSTTLATNAVIEERGARVGLFVIGMVKQFKLPVAANVFLKGGHDIMGREQEPLDLDQLVDTLQDLRKDVDSYAVCAAMSFQNPAHELVAQKAITLLDPKPVFCSHEISQHAGMQERAATACLHARLMPVMEKFIGSVSTSMETIGLDCPVIMISGEGKSVSLEEAVQRAAVTVASGPAATVHFGVTGGEPDAVIVDVGGTTTDVCMIRDGQPLISEEGCRIGPWQTHVRAVDMATGAGGGDSHVVCDKDGRILLEKYRVQPLCMTPGLPDPKSWLGSGRNDSLIIPLDGAGDQSEQGRRDEVLDYLVTNGPATPQTIAEKTRMTGVTLEKHLERLTFKQKIVRVGFTPTDALHVLQKLALGDRAAACGGAEVLAAEAGLSVEDLCQRVLRLTEDRIETIILDYLGRKVWGYENAATLVNRRDNELFEMRCRLKLPVIGIGAAAGFFLPGVAERLGTSVRFPAHHEVGNAMGAGMIALRVGTW